MLSFRPAWSRLRAKVGQRGPLIENALEVREIEPASTWECESPIALPGELERVKQYFGRPDDQLPRLLARSRTEGPTLSYRFRDAVLADFTIYSGDRYLVLRSGGKRPVLTGTPRHFEEAQLCSTNCTETYFGHLLRDGLPIELLAEQRDMPGLTFQHKAWAHEPEYRLLLELPTNSVSHARVETLWIVDERALNAGWASRFGALRDRLRGAVEPSGNQHVFMRRGRAGETRNLINEDEISQRLAGMGFTEIAPEGMSAKAIGSALRDAEVVVTVEGSAQNHALLAMPAGAALITIQPPYRFNSIGKTIGDPFGIRFGFTVADPAENGFKLDFDRLRRTLDLIP